VSGASSVTPIFMTGQLKPHTSVSKSTSESVPAVIGLRVPDSSRPCWRCGHVCFLTLRVTAALRLSWRTRREILAVGA
jgi:hypothetical protein